MSDSETLLSVENLSTHFFTEEGIVKAVQDVGFSIKKGKTFALVGESGCGKTVTALSIMRLVPAPQGKIVGGKIIFEGKNLLALGKNQMRQVRGRKIAMIFQEPMTSLNPVYTVGSQIAEAVRLHQKKSKKETWADAIEMLRKVGIAEPAQRAREGVGKRERMRLGAGPIRQRLRMGARAQYPHQMSGGMQQRVMIAMAASCEPALLIADEPTTALDVTIQAQILDLLDELQRQSGMSILLITHDLGVVAQRAQDVAVMYASRIVEVADSQSLFKEPLHPYTRGLLESLPRLGFRGRRLPTISGGVPEPLHFPAGCKFHPRCPRGCDDRRCQTVEPELQEVQPGRRAACWYAK